MFVRLFGSVSVSICGLFPSPCEGEDEGEGPITARYFARDSRFCLCSERKLRHCRLFGLSLSYLDSVSTLSGVTLTLATRWTGVVGPNAIDPLIIWSASR
jgi:hypothetical protein